MGIAIGRLCMTAHDCTWIPVTQYAHGYEADIAIARLEAEGILAVKRGDGFTGVICPGYDQRLGYRVQVLVPSDDIEAARRILSPSDGTV
jgi:hypothetical protein